MDTDPDVTEPDAPEWVKSYRRIWYHVRREGSVIRGAPGAFLLAALITCGFEHWYLSDRFEDRYSVQISGLQRL